MSHAVIGGRALRTPRWWLAVDASMCVHGFACSRTNDALDDDRRSHGSDTVKGVSTKTKRQSFDTTTRDPNVRPATSKQHSLRIDHRIELAGC
jgi:hypothetical protein